MASHYLWKLELLAPFMIQMMKFIRLDFVDGCSTRPFFHLGMPLWSFIGFRAIVVGVLPFLLLRFRVHSIISLGQYTIIASLVSSLTSLRNSISSTTTWALYSPKEIKRSFNSSLLFLIISKADLSFPFWPSTTVWSLRDCCSFCVHETNRGSKVDSKDGDARKNGRFLEDLCHKIFDNLHWH